MNTEELTEHARRLRDRLKAATQFDARGLYAEMCKFLRVYGGGNSDFYGQAKSINGYFWQTQREHAAGILQSFIDYVDSGLQSGITPRRQAELDVVSDILAQAEGLLADTEVHPAAAAVLVGACLEEFLRTWVEAAALSLGGRRPGIESYASALRGADLLAKQDVKDVTSWAGIRNHAAHGEWDQVESRDRVRLMLEGVNLFIRAHRQRPPA